MKAAIIFGTRPEAIKMIPLVKALRQRTPFEVSVITTGQHREMLDQVFGTFGERPDIDLGLMQPGQTLAEITSAVVTGVARVLAGLKPDLVLVHGDTSTAMAAAMAAFYARCKIGHVEAGLRSFDRTRPWPEEFNRVAIDAVADYAFAPTEVARLNLLGEYNRGASIHVTGNTGIDALLYVAGLVDGGGPAIDELARRYAFLDPNRALILVTGHRRESFGDGFERISDGLALIAERPDIELLYPVHRNPQVQDTVYARLGAAHNIHLVPPVGYLDMVYLMKRARLIVTDSGGLQEEGPALGRPVLVLRDVTERPEVLAGGAVTLVGTDAGRLKSAVDRLLDDPAYYQHVARPVFPYGQGMAAQRIAEILAREFS